MLVSHPLKKRNKWKNKPFFKRHNRRQGLFIPLLSNSFLISPFSLSHLCTSWWLFPFSFSAPEHTEGNFILNRKCYSHSLLHFLAAVIFLFLFPFPLMSRCFFRLTKFYYTQKLQLTTPHFYPEGRLYQYFIHKNQLPVTIF